jgi:hypothetical protein
MVLACMAVLCGGRPTWAAAPSPAERIAAALQNVEALPRTGQNGYATVWVDNAYVQCAQPDDGGLRCEAAGVAMQPSLAHVLTSDRIGRLQDLGWRLDTHFGNFVRVFPAAVPPAAVAAEIVRVLTDAYGADLSQLETKAAWLPREPCPPRNGFSQNLAGMVNDDPRMAAFAVHACSYQPPSVEPDPTGSLDELIARYGPRVAAELQRLRVNDGRDRIFVVFQTGTGYIQCEPTQKPDGDYCEAQSPDSWAALRRILTPDKIARLHAAGYADPGKAPNYAKTYPFADDTDDTVAHEVLTLLHDVYGYDGSEPLEILTEAGREP